MAIWFIWLYKYISKYSDEEAEIENLINEYYNSFEVSFGRNRYIVNLGDTLTLTEIHNNLNGYIITSQSDGLNAKIEGNNLIINPTVLGKYIQIIAEFSDSMNIILTSHSPYLLQYISLSKIYIGVENDKGNIILRANSTFTGKVVIIS